MAATRPDVRSYPSSRTPGLTYTTVHHAGVFTCNCLGYTKRSVRECTHTKQFAAELGVTPVALPPVVQPQQPNLLPDVGGYVAPMLASPLKEGRSLADYEGGEYVMEEKFDGHRRILHVGEPHSRDIVAFSRDGLVNPLPRHIRKAAELLPHATFDGEIVVPGGVATDVKDAANDDKLVLVLFDILSVNGQSCMGMGQYERRMLLDQAVMWLRAANQTAIMLAKQYEVEGTVLERIYSEGGEGVIVKHVNGVYQPGKRSKDWVKVKRLESAALTVTGFEDGLLGPHSKILLIDDDGNEARVKTLNDAWREHFAAHADEFIGKRLVISFDSRTRSGKYRSAMADHWEDGSLA